MKHRPEWGDSNSGGMSNSRHWALASAMSGFKGGAVDELLVFDRELTALEVIGLNAQYSTTAVTAEPTATTNITKSTDISVPETPERSDVRFEHYLRRFTTSPIRPRCFEGTASVASRGKRTRHSSAANHGDAGTRSTTSDIRIETRRLRCSARSRHCRCAWRRDAVFPSVSSGIDWGSHNG